MFGKLGLHFNLIIITHQLTLPPASWLLRCSMNLFIHPSIIREPKSNSFFCLVLNFEEFSEGATGTITTLYDQTATTPCLSFYHSSPLTDNTLSPAWDMRVYHFTFSFFFVDAYTLYEYTAFTREGGKRSQDPGAQVHRRYPVTLLHASKLAIKNRSTICTTSFSLSMYFQPHPVILCWYHDV